MAGNLTPEALARKAQELNVTMDVVHQIAEKFGQSPESVLRKIDCGVALDDDVEDTSESDEAAAIVAVQERRAALESGRDRSQRVRVAGHKAMKLTHEDGREVRMLVPIALAAMLDPTVRPSSGAAWASGSRNLDLAESKMLADLAMWVRWMQSQATAKDGASEPAIAILRRLHGELGWTDARRCELLLRVACRVALMYRLAGSRPPLQVPNTGRAIVEEVTENSKKDALPPWLTAEMLPERLDNGLKTSTLARGGAGLQNVDRMIDDLLADLT